MDKIVLPATSRTELGKQVKKLRTEGKVPAVVYGRGVDTQTVTLDRRAAEKVFAVAGGNKIITLELDKGNKNVLFQEVTIDAQTGDMIHADLFLVKMDELIKTDVPLHFTGESTAVYQEGGTLFKNKETVEVEALPASLPEMFDVDISILDDFEKSIHVRDLVVPEGVEILDDVEELVVKVEAPRSDEELAELEEEVVEELPEGVEEVQAVVTKDDSGGKGDR